MLDLVIGPPGVTRMNAEERPANVAGQLIPPQHDDKVFHTHTEVGIQKTMNEKEATGRNIQGRKRLLKA
jgi:hypothetical protein